MAKRYLIFFFLILPFLAPAQVSKKGSWNLSAGADFLVPERRFRATHNSGFGATFKAEYLFSRHASLILSTGWYQLQAKTNVENPEGDAVSGIPVKAGLRYYFGNFYIGGDGGYLRQSGFNPANGVVWSFFIGDEIINRRNGNSLDISVRHEAWDTDRSRAFIGIRLAYEFRIGQ